MTPVDALTLTGVIVGLAAIVGLNAGLLYTLWAERRRRNG